MRLVSDSIVRAVAQGTRLWGPRWNARPLRKLYSPDAGDAIDEVVDWKGIRLKLSTASALEWNLYFYSWQWYEPEVRSIIQTSLVPGDQAIDVGANVGLHTIFMARASGAGRVVACEPNPMVLPRLEVNLRLNEVGNVRIVPKAVTSKAGQVSLSVPNDSLGLQAWASLRFSHDEYLHHSHPIAVPGVTLDEIVDDSDCDRVRLIKIDTEGFEPEVLYGGKQVLGSQRPDLIFEYTKPWWKENGHELEEILGWLESLGYKAFYEIARDGLRPVDQDAEVANIMARA
jgi:FkbM family methyltransferase